MVKEKTLHKELQDIDQIIPPFQMIKLMKKDGLDLIDRKMGDHSGRNQN